MNPRAGIYTIPNGLTVLRVLLTGALFFPPFPQNRALFLTGFCAAHITDLLDGYLARRWNQVSDFGMRLDSYADYLLIASGVYWALYEPAILTEHWIAWVALGVVVLVPQVIALVRYRRNPGFHLYTAKLSGWLAFVLLASALAFPPHSHALLYFFFIATVVKAVEETAICCFIEDPFRHVRASLFEYLALRNRSGSAVELT